MITKKIIPLLFLISGLFVLVQVNLPLIEYKFWELAQIKNGLPLVSPQGGSKDVLGVSIKTEDNFPAFVSNSKRETPALYSQFSISIPSIDINEEAVFVDSNDLSKGLIHLPGSALPGEKGNAFISGHSALPQLAPPGTKIIFSKLQKLKNDDSIILSASGSKFVYKVVSIKIIRPTDTSVILPPDSIGRYVTLMTCVPPGLNTKRLIILAKLI